MRDFFAKVLEGKGRRHEHRLRRPQRPENFKYMERACRSWTGVSSLRGVVVTILLNAFVFYFTSELSTLLVSLIRLLFLHFKFSLSSITCSTTYRLCFSDGYTIISGILVWDLSLKVLMLGVRI